MSDNKMQKVISIPNQMVSLPNLAIKSTISGKTILNYFVCMDYIVTFINS